MNKDVVFLLHMIRVELPRSRLLLFVMNCFSWTVFPTQMLTEQTDFTSRCLSFCVDRLILILTDLQQYFFFFRHFWVGWGEQKINVRITLVQMTVFFSVHEENCNYVLNDHVTYCLNDICIHLKLLAVEVRCNVCLFTSVVFILEVFLVIIIRLHFSLKDDQENNQIILDLAVYRSEFFFS